MAINRRAISVSDPGAVPGVSTILLPAFLLVSGPGQRKQLSGSGLMPLPVRYGDEIGSTVV